MREGGDLFHSGSNGTNEGYYTMTKYYSLSFLFGVFHFSRPNFAEHYVLHFKRTNICRTGKCSAEREAFRNGLSELDNVAPKTTLIKTRNYSEKFVASTCINMRQHASTCVNMLEPKKTRNPKNSRTPV